MKQLNTKSKLVALAAMIRGGPMKNQGIRARHLASLILALAGLISVATLVLGPARFVSAQAVGPSWSYTGSLNTARYGDTATLLPGGKVLVAGGNYASNCCDLTAELYDPANGSWSSTGSATWDRGTGREPAGSFGSTATLLPSGKVLVAGGTLGDSPFNTAELYDPATGTWSITGNLNAERQNHTATLLPTGKVLVVGGLNYDLDDSLNSAELYDPATGRWSSTGSLNTGRVYHTATLLPNGKVLVEGGFDGGAFDSNRAVSSAELYDPVTGAWSSTGSLNTARIAHAATLLPNGKVLVAGGFDGGIFDINQALSSAELYDPATGTWSSAGNLNTARHSPTATLLPSGQVLVMGSGNSAELYDPPTGTWSSTANLNAARVDYTATLLSNGRVLVAGGGGGSNPNLGALTSAELYDPASLNPNSIDDPRFFVRQHYLDFLNREPDAGGLSYWMDQITQCGSDARCIRDRRLDVSAAFFVEQEFQDTGYYVYRFYKASFGRQPSYNEFASDQSRVIGGTNLETNKQVFADEWVQRPAFLEAYPITMSTTEAVNKLFDMAGLTDSMYDPQRQQEIQAMAAGRSRGLVLRDVIEIPDFRNIPDPGAPRYGEVKQTSQYNPAFVLMQYFGYLRRNRDQSGYDFWLEVVNNREPNNYRGMVCAFITSTEYQLRFGSQVTRSNADCGQ